jgi:hypothetical protein
MPNQKADQARVVALHVLHLWEAPDVVRQYLITGDPNLREEAHGEAVMHTNHIEKEPWAQEAASAAMWACGRADETARLNATVSCAAAAIKELDATNEIKDALKAVEDAKAAMDIAISEWKKADYAVGIVHRVAYNKAHARIVGELGIEGLYVT